MLRNLRAKADYKQTILRNQLTSLVLYEVIETTQAKAGALEPFANHFFNKVKDADLSAKKLAHATLFDVNAVKKVFEEILPRFKSGETTFVKVLNCAPRRGDSAAMAIVALTKTLVAAEAPKVAEEAPKADSKVKVTTRTKKGTK